MRFPKAIMMKGQARSGMSCSQGWLGWMSTTSSDITVIVFSSSEVTLIDRLSR